MSSSKKIQIIMFSMSNYLEWAGGVENRNYQILQHLIKDERVEKVITVDYLPHNWRRFFKNWKNLFKKNSLEKVKSGLFTKIYKVSDKLRVFSSALSKISPKRFYREINRFVAGENCANLIVWSFYPLATDYFLQIPAKLYVFDTVDNWAEHPSYCHHKKQLIENYKTIDKKADLIFTVSNDLQNLYENFSKVYWAPNGVDVKHFQQKYAVINRDIGEIKKPIIGYIGTIQDRLDQDLLEYLVKNNPDKSFVMIGPVWYKEIAERFAKYSNIYFLGRKSYQEAPMYVQQFDVGIIPHRIDKFVKSTNPMKMYEYLACQKPVVSTTGGDVEQFADLIHITNVYQEFNQSIAKALNNDSEKLRKARFKKAQENSWLKRTDEMLKLIEQKL